MNLRTILRLAMVGPCFLTLSALAQSGDGPLNIKDRVLDILFPLKAPTSPFLTKMTLRFGDSDTQIVVLTYPVYPAHQGGRAEIISYSITGMGNANLSEFCAKMVAREPDVTAREIAGKLKVNVTHVPINLDALEILINDLKAMRISPVLKNRAAVDDYAEYGYWYDTGQESVHYSIVGPFKDANQDRVAQWMDGFKKSLLDMEKVPIPKP